MERRLRPDRVRGGSKLVKSTPWGRSLGGEVGGGGLELLGLEERADLGDANVKYCLGIRPMLHGYAVDDDASISK